LRELSIFITVAIILFGFAGCGEDAPSSGGGVEPIQTGISGTTYLNVEHGFRLSNLPDSNWVIKTQSGKNVETKIEQVLLMVFGTEDEFTFDMAELINEKIPCIGVLVSGPDPDLPSKPDLAKEIMDYRIATWQWMGAEVLSRKPVAGVNATGYEATLSIAMVDYTLIIKEACFAKNDMGYTIYFIAPEDEFMGLIAYVDPIIASFELLGL